MNASCTTHTQRNTHTRTHTHPHIHTHRRLHDDPAAFVMEGDIGRFMPSSSSLTREPHAERVPVKLTWQSEGATYFGE